ncbi:MAG TPA: GNAT family N-acetyltransferase [Chitinophagaceae bacterium]|nr:GNAT family N-acetyltransferase [Chitinophagaceae bacterium]
MEVQPIVCSDLNPISSLQPAGWPDILPYYEHYTKAAFCFPIKVILDNKIVGIGTTIIHNDTAWLGHIIVHPDYRGKGIGRYITETLVTIAKQRECGTIYLIATDLGAPVYEKAGFSTETDYLFFKDIQLVNESPVPDKIVGYREEFRNQISTIDRANSGEERMFRLENHLQNGFVYCEDYGVEGFYLPTLGDGLIIANTPAAGLELMKLHLKSNGKLALPRDNSSAINFLYSHGFKEIRTAKRMRLGKPRIVNLANIYNRIAGNIG